MAFIHQCPVTSDFLHSNKGRTISCHFCTHKIIDLSKKSKSDVEYYLQKNAVQCVECDNGVLEDDRSFLKRISGSFKIAKASNSGLKYLAYGVLFDFSTVLISCIKHRRQVVYGKCSTAELSIINLE